MTCRESFSGVVTWLGVLCLVVGVSAPAFAAEPGDLGVSATVSGGAVSWDVPLQHAGMRVTVRAPSGAVVGRSFDPGEPAVVDLVPKLGDPLPDGLYTWEVRLRPVLSSGARNAIETADGPVERDAVHRKLVAGGELSRNPMVISSTFRIDGGVAWTTDLRGGVDSQYSDRRRLSEGGAKDEVILDDLIVNGSVCVGLDCVSGETFGSDTLRLKENNLRIHFDDTSTSAGFPKNDWRLVVNSRNDGGPAFFAVQDATAGRKPFLIEAGAPEDALRVDSGGRFGAGTANPVVELHFMRANTPTIRFEQDGSSWPAYTWDLAANEANFFVRDIQAGTLPFRIMPAPPDDALVVESDGGIGVGTETPDANLHVYGHDGATHVHIEEACGTVDSRTVLEMENNGGVFFDLVDTDTGTSWRLGNTFSTLTWIGPNDNGFVFTDAGVFQLLPNGTQQFTFQPNGDLEITGTLTQNVKRSGTGKAIGLDPSDVLRRLPRLGLYRWSSGSAVHVGPSGSELASVFGIGRGDSVAPVDVATVAILSVRGLQRLVADQQRELDALRTANRELEERVAALEAVVAGAAE